MRLGVFGGTFDPPHLGHLLAAVDALEKLSLDRILYVPNYVQPLKPEAHADAVQRLAMVHLLAKGDSRFGVESIEVDRGGISYTVDTLEDLSRRNSGATFFFLAGQDVLSSFTRWKDPRRIGELATVTLVTRSGSPDVEGSLALLPPGSLTLMTRTVDISSSEIRNRVRDGLSIRGFVTPEVEEYISNNGLYKRVKE